jgi:soluble lytic murein transglycosylase-like protein
MSGRRLGRLALALLALGVHPAPAQASDEVVLARLRRIARGEWRAPRSTLSRVPYAHSIRAAARRYGLSASLLAALVRAESGFEPNAVSSAGARGLGQLMPATARALGISDPFDPAQNLDGSARYLAEQVDRFGSVRLALAAYHAGPKRARRGLHTVPATTRVYVARVLRYEREYRERGLP